MRRIKAWIRAFFGFSRAETNAFIILLPLMFVVLFSEPLYRQWRTRKTPDFNSTGLDSLMARLEWDDDDGTVLTKKVKPPIHITSFDPNTVAEKELIRMGLTPGIANRIIRYRQKGGIFRKQEDLLKIYGFDSAWFQQARKWIAIEQKNEVAGPIIRKEKRDAAIELIDINLADSVQLLTVYGIGPVLSKRIRTFRDRLGGFVTMDQVKEVYGLDSSVVSQIRRKFIVAENFLPGKINLNRATLDEMIKHPYMKRREAQAILSFRLQHGDVTSVDQLTEIKSLTENWIAKIRPYLVLE